MYFFAVKAFTRLFRNFFEICRRGGCSILRLVDSLERPTLASRVPLFLLGHFQTNECEISDFCL